MIFPKCNQRFYVIKQSSVRLKPAPVKPPRCIILTINVIISFLRIVKFISRQKTRCSLRQQQQKKRISDLTFPQIHNTSFTALSLCAAIPTIIIVRTVCIIFSIFFVMFVSERTVKRNGSYGMWNAGCLLSRRKCMAGKKRSVKPPVGRYVFRSRRWRL